MIEVSVADAKALLPKLLRAAEAGQRVVITRYGKPIAELRALDHVHEPWSLKSVHAHLRAMGHEPREIATPPDFDDPLPDSFWLGQEA